MPLDPDQLHAASWGPADSPALTVQAGAGAGKTHTLTALVEALVTPAGRTSSEGIPGKGVDPTRVVVATFARDAAKELKARLASRLPATTVEALAVGTFHALAGRALRTYEAWRWDFGRNLDGTERSEGIPGSMQLWRAVLSSRALPAAWHVRSPVYGVNVAGEPDRYAQAVDLLRASGSWHTGRAASTVQLASFQAAWKLYEEVKRHCKWWDYADLLSAWRFALLDAARAEGTVPAGLQGAGEEGPGKPGTGTTGASQGVDDDDPAALVANRKRRQALRGGRIVLVDEAQDNNRVQLDLARLLARGPDGRVVLIGDERQTVHGWRGADPTLFLQGLPGTEARPVRRNYRARQELVDFANEVQRALQGFGNGGRSTDTATLVAGKAHAVVWGQQVHHEAMATRGAGGKVTFRSWGVAPDEAAGQILAAVVARHDAGAPFAAHAILCRTNASVAVFEQAAIRAGVPVALAGAQPFWTQRLPEAVLAYARLIQGDYPTALKGAWNQPLRYLPVALADRAVELVQTGRAASFAAAVGTLAYEGKGKQQKTLHEFSRLLDDLRRSGWPAGLDLVQRALAPVARGADQAARQGACNGADDTREAELHAALVEARRHESPRALHAAVVTGLQRATDAAADRLTISTIHRFKGREAPVVYYWAPKGEAPRGGSKDEEACLFYVACTRARDELHVAWAEHALDGETRTGPGAFLRLPPLRSRLPPAVAAVAPARRVA